MISPIPYTLSRLPSPKINSLSSYFASTSWRSPNYKEDLPEIDPQKVSLQIPSEIVAAGFNVVNRGAPVFGEIIQRTAERLVNVGASLKPLFASSFGFGGAGANLKRETGDGRESPFEQENEASSDSMVTAEAPSQFKRSYNPSENSQGAQSELLHESNEEEKLRNILLAKKIIEKLLEKQVEEEPEDQNALIKPETWLGEDVNENLDKEQISKQSPPGSKRLSPEELSSLASNAPQAFQKSPNAEEAFQSNLSDLQSDPSAFQSSTNAEQNISPIIRSSPTVVQSSSSAFQRSRNIFQSNPSELQSNPSSFQSSPPAFQNRASTFLTNPSAFPLPPSNNPYYHQQYRDYNSHVKRQAPQNDYYKYQLYQNVPRYRPQYGNQYLQNGYQSYAF